MTPQQVPPQGVVDPLGVNMAVQDPLGVNLEGESMPQSDDERIAKLKKIRERSSPDQQARIDKMIGQLGNKTLGNIVKGAATGVADMPMAFADLALSAGQIGSRAFDPFGGTARAIAPVRERMTEARQDLRGLIPQPEQGSLAGALAEFGGSIAAGAVPFGGLAGVAGKTVVSGLESAAPKLAASVGKMLLPSKISGNVATRVFKGALGNVLSGMPISAVQAIGMKDAPAAERWQAFAQMTGADLLFGGTAAAVLGKAKLPIAQKLKAEAATIQGPAGGPATDEGASLSARLKAKADTDKAAKDLLNRAKRERDQAVWIDWTQKNPGKVFAELTKEQKTEVLKTWKQENPNWKASEAATAAPKVEVPAAPTRAEAALKTAGFEGVEEAPVLAKINGVLHTIDDTGKATPVEPSQRAIAQVQDLDAAGTYNAKAAQWFSQLGKLKVGENIPPDVLAAEFKFNNGTLKTQSEMAELLKSWDLNEFSGGSREAWALKNVAVEPVKVADPQVAEVQQVAKMAAAQEPPVITVKEKLGTPADEDQALQNAIDQAGIKTELPDGTQLNFADRQFILGTGAGPGWIEVTPGMKQGDIAPWAKIAQELKDRIMSPQEIVDVMQKIDKLPEQDQLMLGRLAKNVASQHGIAGWGKPQSGSNTDIYNLNFQAINEHIQGRGETVGLRPTDPGEALYTKEVADNGSKTAPAWKDLSEDQKKLWTEMAGNEEYNKANPIPKGTDAEGVDQKAFYEEQLAQMEKEHLDLINEYDKKSEADPAFADGPEGKQLMAEIEQRGAEYHKVDQELHPVPKLDEGSTRSFSEPARGPTEVAPVVEEPPFDIRLLRKKPGQLSIEELPKVIDELDTRLISSLDHQEKADLNNAITKYQNELASRQPPRDPLQANLPLPMGGAGLGLAYGYWTGDPQLSEDERILRALKYGAAGAGLAYGGAKGYAAWRSMQLAKKPSYPGPNINGIQIDKRVISREEISRPEFNLVATMRKWYQGAVRSSFGMQGGGKLYGPSGGFTYWVKAFKVPAQRDPIQLTHFAGRFVSQTEKALTSELSIIDPATGNPVVLYPKGLNSIPQEYFGGDKNRMGNLAVAAYSQEMRGKRNVPFNPVEADLVLGSATPQEIQGLHELRAYYLALSKAALISRRLSQEGFDAMKQQEFYTHIEPIVDKMISLTGRKDALSAPTEIQGSKKGTTKQVLNPFDAAVEMTARTLRNAEYNHIGNSMVDIAELAPKELGAALMSEVPNSQNPDVSRIKAAVLELQKQTKISEKDAQSLLALYDYSEDMFKTGRITVWRDGVLRSYNVNSEIFESMRAMRGYEANALVKLMSIPARVTARGVALDPVFILWQGLIVDPMTSIAQSKYGFDFRSINVFKKDWIKSTGMLPTPGFDTFRGWWHSVRNTPELRKIFAAGAPVTLQSLQYTNPKTASTATLQAGGSALETAVHQLREVGVGIKSASPIKAGKSLLDAYKTLVYPLAQAARVGEAMRALDHGESAITAAFAAWDIQGNPRMMGAWPMIRALNNMTPFLRPSIAALDKTFTESGLHPFQTPSYAKVGLGARVEGSKFDKNYPRLAPRATAGVTLAYKAFAAITVPSVLLWVKEHYENDTEIKQLRGTTMGQRYWFIRSPITQEIFKMRKPQVLGEIFGATAEAALDKAFDNDPASVKQLIDAVMQDASVNIIPTIGVIPLGLLTGKDVSTGSNIGSAQNANIDPGIAGYAAASLPARVIGQATGSFTRKLDPETWYGRLLRTGLSPAGADWVIRSSTGMLGQDATQLMTNALEWAQDGSAPPANEWGMVKRLLIKTPTTNVRDVEKFYDKQTEISGIARTLDFYAKNQPEYLQRYIADNVNNIALISKYRQAGLEIAELRRAIDDLKAMPSSTWMTGEAKQKTIDGLVRSITQIAHAMRE